MDRIAASKTYQGEAYRNWHPLEYYEKGCGRTWKNEIQSGYSKTLHELLGYFGRRRKKNFSYIKHVLLKQKKY